MDMTKDIMDFEQKLDGEQYEPSDYTMVNIDIPKQPEQTAELAYEPAKSTTDAETPLDEPPLQEPPANSNSNNNNNTEQAVAPGEEAAQESEEQPKLLVKQEMLTEAVEQSSGVRSEQPLTPPPRPLTSSEVESSDPELRVQLTAKKSRSLPVSPQPLVSHNLSAIGLFEFGKKRAAGAGAAAGSTAAELEHKPKLGQKLAQRKASPVGVGVGVGVGDNQQFCLRWNNYQSNLTNVFDELLQNESFVDVTLACEGHSIKAHKMVLSACSPYFQALFYDNPCQHPIIIMRDVSWSDLKALVEFMYKGEINVCQDQINPLLKVAETLKIRGLAEVSAGSSSAAAAAAAAASASSLLPEQRMTFDSPRQLPKGIKYKTATQTETETETKNVRAAQTAPPRRHPAAPLGLKLKKIASRRQAVAGGEENYIQSSSKATNKVGGVGRGKDATSPPRLSSALVGRDCSLMLVVLASPQPLPPPPRPVEHTTVLCSICSSKQGRWLGGGDKQEGAGVSSLCARLKNKIKIALESNGFYGECSKASGKRANRRNLKAAKMIETGGHGWMGAPATGTSVAADSYQYQLQSMWQKCWNTNQQNLVQQLRFRERGPLKSWRPEAMAEAIFSVLKEGLSLSQAARKYDIPYPTFVLYANRVHNMLGPSLDGGTDPRPKARGRPQRILLGMWPEELIRSVIKAVVFRDYREIKEDMGAHQYANGQAHGAHFGSGNSAAAANGYHSAAVKMAAQNAALAPPDSSNPLSTMTETLRRQILSQQQPQQSPHVQSMNMYKSPAYLQRSEIEDQVSAAAAVAAAKHQQNERRGTENLPDLSALGLMGLPGLNVMPTQQAPHQRGAGAGGGGGGGAGAAMHPSAASYARELSREREREREMSRDRELKEAMHARQYGNQSRGSNSSGGSKSASGHGASSNRPGAASPYSTHYAKHQAKEQQQQQHPNYAYNKRFLESLPAGIDFEAIANGLLQKSVNKSPRFEDFFPGQDMSELFASADANAGAAAAAAAAAAAYAPAGVRESPLMKIKLEQQQATELPHED
ncbi:hypothetical protein KR093_007157 [Drosophila rubida]|uniref:Protein bric-a-brac 2 n=1 Tax=Drosophila rubida TaxID=30044 RepID=A0AAD4JXQ8_9MUSC|nr:hypothetical protein KR093_007157 [Drosophila rubida]